MTVHRPLRLFAGSVVLLSVLLAPITPATGCG